MCRPPRAGPSASRTPPHPAAQAGQKLSKDALGRLKSGIDEHLKQMKQLPWYLSVMDRPGMIVPVKLAAPRVVLPLLISFPYTHSSPTHTASQHVPPAPRRASPLNRHLYRCRRCSQR